MADVMSEQGYGAAGYEYIIIDDCWLANKRDNNGRLQPDPDRFPSGIKALSDYVRLGIICYWGINARVIQILTLILLVRSTSSSKLDGAVRDWKSVCYGPTRHEALIKRNEVGYLFGSILYS